MRSLRKIEVLHATRIQTIRTPPCLRLTTTFNFRFIHPDGANHATIAGGGGLVGVRLCQDGAGFLGRWDSRRERNQGRAPRGCCGRERRRRGNTISEELVKSLVAISPLYPSPRTCALRLGLVGWNKIIHSTLRHPPTPTEVCFELRVASGLTRTELKGSHSGW